jgi:hypothetical protein
MTTIQRAHTRTTREQLLYDVHTHARLENDYYTTTIRRAQTQIDTDTHIHTHIHTHTHNTHTHNTHTHTHIQHTHTHTHIHTHTHTKQEAANYVAAEEHCVVRSDKLRCSRSASCSKKRQTTFMRT